MDLSKLIEIVDDVYLDGQVGRYWNNGEGMPEVAELGDGLAKFIALELSETFDPDLGTEAQLEEAARVMDTAANDLLLIVDAIRSTTIDQFDSGDSELEK